MRMLITGDLHLTDRPEDGYRFVFLDWLQGLAHRENVNAVVLLGDLTDAKDNHSAALVDRLVEVLVRLADASKSVYVLQGNHDYAANPNVPFFKFLSNIPGLTYVNSPRICLMGRRTQAVFVPHLRIPRVEGAGSAQGNWDAFVDEGASDCAKADIVFLHQTFAGAVAAGGHKLAGVSIGKRWRGLPIYSGDVHVPQTLGRIHYVGAPYPIHFGDDYTPTVILYDCESGEQRFVPPHIWKQQITIRSLEDLDQCKFGKGDQIRVVVELPRSEFGDWPEMKADIQEYFAALAPKQRASLFGIELHEAGGRVHLAKDVLVRRLQRPDEILTSYCKHTGMTDPETLKVGRELLETDDGV